MSKSVTRTKECPGRKREDGTRVGCGNTIYTAELGDRDTKTREFQKIWRCANCGFEEPRKSVRRRTTKAIAIDVWRELKTAWEPTDQALQSLLNDRRIKSGAILVYDSVFNHYMDKLLNNGSKLTRWELSYYTSEAKKDLEKAKRFVSENQANGDRAAEPAAK